MIEAAKRWHVGMVLLFVLALAVGCAQHYYAPGDAGPDNLRVNTQLRYSGSLAYRLDGSALVVRPDGSYQRVDNLKIWLKTKDLHEYGENYGQYEISAFITRMVAPSDDPKVYACAMYKGATFCGGDPAAKP